MSIKTYHFYESGSIPGQEGIFPAGVSVSVDEETGQIVNRQPILPPSDVQTEEDSEQLGGPTQPLDDGGSN